jgi:hypothetical protein
MGRSLQNRHAFLVFWAKASHLTSPIFMYLCAQDDIFSIRLLGTPSGQGTKSKYEASRRTQSGNGHRREHALNIAGLIPELAEAQAAVISGVVNDLALNLKDTRKIMSTLERHQTTLNQQHRHSRVSGYQELREAREAVRTLRRKMIPQEANFDATFMS